MYGPIIRLFCPSLSNLIWIIKNHCVRRMNYESYFGIVDKLLGHCYTLKKLLPLAVVLLFDPFLFEGGIIITFAVHFLPVNGMDRLL